MSQSGSRGNLAGASGEFNPSAASQAHVQDSARLLDKAWEDVQRRTFTRWVNEKLKLRGLQIADLTHDLSDGVALINLLEVIGDESLGRFNKNPKMRIQKVENLNTALAFIRRRGIHLTNIGSEDIVDGNDKLVLGLIWTLILRFTIADISEEGLTAKEGLLLWCQRKTAPYQPAVNVKDFTFSFQDGLAFCALIHRHRPDLLDFHALNKSEKKKNMQLAFDVAHEHLGVPKLLDVDDVVDLVRPDERSVMTYVASYFHVFSSMDRFEVAGRRVGKFVAVLQSTLEMTNDYERRAQALLQQLAQQQAEWQATTLAEQYSAAKQQSQQFNQYKSTIKRAWVQEKRDLDALLGNIQTKMATYHLKPYTPPQGLALADVDAHWHTLLSSEASFKKAINAKIKSIKEALEVKFAQLATALQKDLNSVSSALGDVSAAADLDEQRARVSELQARVPALREQLTALGDVNAECVAANIEENELTILSYDDLAFDLGVVEAALNKKFAFLDNQAAARQMTNVTPQQLEEFETTFRHFDKDASNSLNSIEFKASLAGLGIALTDDEFTRVFEATSAGTGEVDFKQFISYMLSMTQDRTSPDQLHEAFAQLAQSKAFLTQRDLQVAQLPAETIAFLTAAMPPAQGDGTEHGGLDYDAYIKSVFPKV